jgi:hypothetical protein
MYVYWVASTEQSRLLVAFLQWHLDSGNSWYDQMWRDLSERGLLAHKGDPYTYRSSHMA